MFKCFVMSKTNFNLSFSNMYNNTLVLVLNHVRAGERVQLFVVLFFCIELKVLSRCYIPLSHIPVCKKCQCIFSLLGLTHLLLKKKLW